MEYIQPYVWFNVFEIISVNNVQITIVKTKRAMNTWSPLLKLQLQAEWKECLMLIQTSKSLKFKRKTPECEYNATRSHCFVSAKTLL